MKLIISQIDKKSGYLKAYAHNPDGSVATLEYNRGKITQRGYVDKALYFLFLEIIDDYFPGGDNEVNGE